MALLTLKDIGKIYVSEGSVAVGIRGVNLSFDRGEFVAVTGKSGSGKSTLLNVISGMDSYEEGELFIEGQPTSHYLQPEWEEYREEYISFIFQDYNIIESFTVLQNVELALMHIEDKKERRARALELIERVGLTSHLSHKGSKLSGGQKQRTVIARALAKDSPIILADEPTGNLDSATSAEIVALLREVSRDKLLIVVTHNFEQLERVATRHIRIFDGAVESDHVISRPVAPASGQAAESESAQASRAARTHSDLKKGFTLGRSIFTAKPRLSLFLCLLLIVGTLGIFLITSFCGSAADLLDPYYMFDPIEGRVVVTRRNGEVMSEEELAGLVAEYGAKSYLHYDALLDFGRGGGFRYYDNQKGRTTWIYPAVTYGKDYGDEIVGRYPEQPGEVLLSLPISYQTAFGKEALLVDQLTFASLDLELVGVHYYYDNNITPECLFTDEGFRVATAAFYLLQNSSGNVEVVLRDKNGIELERLNYSGIAASYRTEPGKIYIAGKEYVLAKSNYGESLASTTVNINFSYYKYDYYSYSDSVEGYTFTKSFSDADLTATDPGVSNANDLYYDSAELVLHPSVMLSLAEEVLARSYRQASLFFESDAAADEAAALLNEKGYMAIPADTTYSPDAMTVISSVLGSLATLLLWVVAIIFLAFFINLCSGRVMDAFKGDMAIMRSMGIPVKIIRIGMYVRMLLSLIPALLMMVGVAILIFTTPRFNAVFTYLYPWQYVMILLGMLLLTLRITHAQLRRLFGESVKKSLRGGGSND